jgi:hypothetical protein
MTRHQKIVVSESNQTSNVMTTAITDEIAGMKEDC